MKKVLYLHNVNTSWVDRDREIIQSQHEVINFYVSSPLSYFSFKWPLQVLKSDILFCWFASFNFFPAILLAKFLGKRILIVSGGFDAAKAEPIGYGAFTKSKVSQRLRKRLFQFADKVLCVSKANMAETIINSQLSGDKCELIYHGFNPVAGEQRAWANRKNQVIMISQCDHSTFYRKGLDQFLKLAELMPDFSFVLVGKVHPDIAYLFDKVAPDNFRYTGFLKFNGEDFINLLDESKFITQLSYYESFGCSVIDGALRGCYPITTSSYALFEVTKDIGRTVDYGNLNVVKDNILEISKLEIDVNQIADKAIQIFPYNAREKAILKVVEG